jgi:hypothetical protein
MSLHFQKFFEWWKILKNGNFYWNSYLRTIQKYQLMWLDVCWKDTEMPMFPILQACNGIEIYLRQKYLSITKHCNPSAYNCTRIVIWNIQTHIEGNVTINARPAFRPSNPAQTYDQYSDNLTSKSNHTDHISRDLLTLSVFSEPIQANLSQTATSQCSRFSSFRWGLM